MYAVGFKVLGVGCRALGYFCFDFFLRLELINGTLLHR